MVNNEFSPTQMPNSPSSGSWQIAGASSIGKSHLDSGLTNQDSFFYQQTSDGSVAVVCDGAGSATMSQQGASYFSQAVGDFLLNNASKIANNFSKNKAEMADYITEALITIRQNLENQIPTEFDLKDYHSTVTAVLVLPHLNQALLIQIGDSPLLASKFEIIHQTSLEKPQIDYFKNLDVFGDDSKNEYINETHFITQDNWRDFLRIDWLDTQQVDCIALMSDGCADLVLAGGVPPRQIYRPFFANMLFNLLQSDSQATGNGLLQTTLDNSATYRLTGDDKTLIVLLKKTAQNADYRNLEPYLVSDKSSQDVSSQNPNSQTVWAGQTGSTQLANTAQSAETIESQNSLSSKNLPSEKNSSSTATNSVQPPINTPLSPTLPQPIKPPAKDKHTQNMLLAGGAILLGLLALAGLNRDWLSERFLAKNGQPAVNKAINEPATTDNQKVPNVLNVTHGDISTPLRVHNLYDSSLLRVVVGFADGQIQMPPSVSIKVGEIYPLTLNKATDTAKSATANTINASHANPEITPLYATAQCQPLTAQNITTQQSVFSQYHITPDPAWQYAQCQVILQGYQDKSGKLQKVALPNGVNDVTLPQGLSAIFNLPAKKSAPITRATATTQADVPIQIYFLPSLKNNKQ